jgi:hypothetical protein
MHAGEEENGGDAEIQGAGEDDGEEEVEEEEDLDNADCEGEETYRPPTHWLRSGSTSAFCGWWPLRNE